MGEYKIIEDEPAGSNGASPPKPDGSSEEKPKEELILGRFKNQDELGKAYQEAEKKMTQEAQKRAELERQLLEIQQRPPAPVKEEQPENLDELFWTKPREVVQREVKGALSDVLSPFIEDRYELAKDSLRTKYPDFAKFEADVDTIVSKDPSLKLKRGGVEGVYKMVKGWHMAQNPDEFEKEVLERARLKQQGKVEGSLESPTGGERGGTVTTINLTDEQKRVARNMNSDLPEEEAYKIYANAIARRDRGEI